MPVPHPTLPSPPPLTASEPGTWAESTVKVRLGEIAARAMEENRFSPEIEARYHALIAEINTGVIRFLDEPLAPDKDAWRAYVKPYLDKRWTAVPWFFAETYFYRRVLEATGFYQPGPMVGVDPFKIQKRLGLEASRNAVLRLREKVDRLDYLEGRPAVLKFLLNADLWGNRADLSLWPVSREGEAGDMTQSESFLLADDTETVVAILFASSKNPRQVDLVADNAGFELMADLLVGDFLLSSGLADELHLHLKAHPTFVSDATASDFEETITFLKKNPASALQAMAARFSQALAAGRLHLHTDSFWTSPLPAWEMPPDLVAHFSCSSMVFVKGDANYRRLLGDLHWPFHTPFSKILTYFPAPVCALRTLKAEIATGLRPTQVQNLQAEDPEWMINGRWGVVQLGGAGSHDSS